MLTMAPLWLFVAVSELAMTVVFSQNLPGNAPTTHPTTGTFLLVSMSKHPQKVT